jgi:hypothetical protein
MAVLPARLNPARRFYTTRPMSAYSVALEGGEKWIGRGSSRRAA